MNTISLVSDPTTSVTIDVVRRNRNWDGEHALVRFEGNPDPAYFRGEAMRRTLDLEAGWHGRSRAGAESFIALLETAFAAIEGRLLLEVNSDIFGVDTATIAVPAWGETQHAGGLTTVSFTATRVAAGAAAGSDYYGGGY